jgi:hypothetical protein
MIWYETHPTLSPIRTKGGGCRILKHVDEGSDNPFGKYNLPLNRKYGDHLRLIKGFLLRSGFKNSMLQMLLAPFAVRIKRLTMLFGNTSLAGLFGHGFKLNSTSSLLCHSHGKVLSWRSLE